MFVQQGSQGPFKSLEIDFSIQGLISPLIQPMSSFCLSGGPFHCCEFLYSPIVNNISKSERRATIFCERAVVFLPQCCKSQCDCMKQTILPPHVAIKGDHTIFFFKCAHNRRLILIKATRIELLHHFHLIY